MVCVGDPAENVVSEVTVLVKFAVNAAFVAVSHRSTVPVWPVTERFPAEEPEHTEVFPLMLPALDGGVTVTSVVSEIIAAHAPLFTIARKRVVCESAPDVKVVDVIAVSVYELKGDTAYCQLVTEPVCPDKVRTADVLPEQMVVPPLTSPPTVSGLTVIVMVFEVAFGTLTQGLLETVSQVTTSFVASVVVE